MGKDQSKLVGSLRHPTTISILPFGTYRWTDLSRAYHVFKVMVATYYIVYQTTRLMSTSG